MVDRGSKRRYARIGGRSRDKIDVDEAGPGCLCLVPVCGSSFINLVSLSLSGNAIVAVVAVVGVVAEEKVDWHAADAVNVSGAG